MRAPPPRRPLSLCATTTSSLFASPAAAACRWPPAVAPAPSRSPPPSRRSLPLRSRRVETRPRRRLILLRHGESAAGGRFTRDHGRPLSKAGRAAAISVSNKLQQMGWIPEFVICSDATRTKETLKIFQEHVKGLSEAIVHFIPSFYSIAAMDGQTAEHLQKAICGYSSDEILTVMCMGHNKGWEEAASMFSGDSVVLKTYNAALVEAAEGKSWVEAFSLAVAGLGGWELHGIVKP
ncbi:hypothetical protein GUJ93_ZPchr0009g1863 [Zizania palustris]|uniref:Uncharacterized protein n=1 Tax=Zizania palustris TaxID=103762 RepID=A0A8J5RHV2_ZIZPA|nr:hypothetical protein GUJ93_ZPchr0009g1863 [Zizania palustris]